MSVWLIGLLLGLPFSVWLLATLCAIIDEPAPVPAMVRLSLGICLILAVLLLTDAELLYPLVTAFIVVVVMHLGSFFLVSGPGTGVPVYERTPPHPPLLEDEINNGNPNSEDAG